MRFSLLKLVKFSFFALICYWSYHSSE